MKPCSVELSTVYNIGPCGSELRNLRQSNYNRATVCLYVCSRFPPRRLAPQAPNFQGLIYDPTNET